MGVAAVGIHGHQNVTVGRIGLRYHYRSAVLIDLAAVVGVFLLAVLDLGDHVDDAVIPAGGVYVFRTDVHGQILGNIGVFILLAGVSAVALASAGCEGQHHRERKQQRRALSYQLHSIAPLCCCIKCCNTGNISFPTTLVKELAIFHLDEKRQRNVSAIVYITPSRASFQAGARPQRRPRSFYAFSPAFRSRAGWRAPPRCCAARPT